jgi:hypothetical protein
MQSIQPQSLTDEELLHQVYLMGNEHLPKVWVEEMCTRMARLLDENNAFDVEKTHMAGFEEGFEAGVEHANDDFK